ncbi:hypothetical protein M426DRAFT_15321 [Hypoxylon sp. CI-4A]|nr:hypothetical protein M426DRAFT_15321 [Hypoxylon sp. CI-4A]
MARAPATSIIEYLTVKNPDMSHQKSNKGSLSTGTGRLVPWKVLPWKDFNLSTIENIFEHKLYEELRLDNSEPAAQHIISRWTRPMVRTALKAVENIFSPMVIAPTSLTKAAISDQKGNEPEESTRAQPGRKCKANKGKSSKRSKSRAVPDWGGIRSSSKVPEQDANGCYKKQSNGLPCEVKSGSIWTSKRLRNGELADSSGKWRPYKKRDRDALPLLQIYDQCVKAEARYGVLITSKEVLAIRISPAEVSSNLENANLIDKLHYRGLLEFEAIPWTNHRSGADYKELTINLAVWFLCILAGNNYEPKWQYGPLVEEALLEKKQSDEKEESVAPTKISEAITNGVGSQSGSESESTQNTPYNLSFREDWDEIGGGIPQPSRKKRHISENDERGSKKKRRAA